MTATTEQTERTRREKQPETRQMLERVMSNLESPRFIEAPEYADILDELLEYIQDFWDKQTQCDIDIYDVARALRWLHAHEIVQVWHRHPRTEEPVHRVALTSVSTQS